jgi:divalent metal cation (Fe/Co/Zn/Cd) transporter
MAAFLITTIIVIVALVLIYGAVKRFYKDDYDPAAMPKPEPPLSDDIESGSGD